MVHVRFIAFPLWPNMWLARDGVSALWQPPFLSPRLYLHASNSNALPPRAFPGGLDRGSNLLVFMQWGFIPVFRQHLNANMIGAGSEVFVNAGSGRSSNLPRRLENQSTYRCPRSQNRFPAPS